MRDLLRLDIDSEKWIKDQVWNISHVLVSLGLKWVKIFFRGGLTVVPGIKPTVYSVGSFLPREDPAAWPKRQMFFLPFFQGWQMFLEWSHWSTSLSSLSGWTDLIPGSSLTLIMQLEAAADLAIQPYLLTHTLMPTTEPHRQLPWSLPYSMHI